MPLGDAQCDSCGAIRVGNFKREVAIQMIRAGGWHHMTGLTIGGVPFESILCKACGHDEHKRPRAAVAIEQEALPLDWEGARVDRTEGIQAR